MRRRVAWLSGLLSLLAALSAGAAEPQAEARPGYLADRECAACHPRQAAAWAGSKHDRAMQAAGPASVLGDFDNARFSAPQQDTRFFRRGTRHFVHTNGPDGRPADFPVTHSFGVHPLQQYLLPLPGGRLQALSVAWDTVRKRWFSLYPDGAFPPGSPLHWSGRYQNWNLMCGECHTTAFRKGYDAASDRYATRWVAPNVGCQACHGPGRAHTESARRGKPVPTTNTALASAHGQVDQCASCHARRTRIVEDAAPGTPLLDNFIPDTLRAGLYYPDGQQLDEVFEYGSFRQSRMYQAGVACSDCHEPHGGKPRATGNALCLRCHSPTPDPKFPGLVSKNYDSPEHHFHAAGQPGSQCVACHMPSRDYMVVHGRRDHAIRIPRPDLTRKIGAPNACQSCHPDRPAEWLEAAIDAQHGARQRPEHYGETLHAARTGQPGADARLVALINDTRQPAIVRATAIESLTGPVPDTAFSDPDPAVRSAAAASLGARPAPERLARLPALLADPLRAVRIAAARGLADIPEAQLAPDQIRLRQRGITEFIAAQEAMADMPSAQINLALLQLELGKPQAAATHYRRAIAQDPGSNAARLGLARQLVASRQLDAATRLLDEGIARSSQPGELHFALGLVAGQQKNWKEAAARLQRAAELMPDDRRIRRNLEAVQRHLLQE